MPAERSDPASLESIGIINALRRGTVPASGLWRFAVGLDAEEETITDQLRLVRKSGADIRFIRGEYGSGKTFLIARALEIARREGFVTARISLSPTTPLHKLRTIYSSIVHSLTAGGEENAFRSVLDAWLYTLEERSGESAEYGEKGRFRETERALEEISRMSPGVAAVIRTYARASAEGDFGTAQAAIGWLSGDPNIGRDIRQKAGIRGDIDESIILSLFRLLPVIVCGAGYSGVAVAIDELEVTQTFPRNLREKGFQNLVRLIDAVDSGQLPHWFLICAGTPMLYDGQRGMRMVQPLYDRIGNQPVDNRFPNPRQIQIPLRPFDEKRLEEVALRVIEVYVQAYGEIDRDRISHRFIRIMVSRVCEAFGGRIDVIPRVFLREFVDILDRADIYPDFDPMDGYRPAPEQAGLTEEERAVVRISW